MVLGVLGVVLSNVYFLLKEYLKKERFLLDYGRKLREKILRWLL